MSGHFALFVRLFATLQPLIRCLAMSTEAVRAPQVDVDVPRFNQGLVALLSGLAFLLDQPWIVAVVAVILGLSWLDGARLGLFTRLYVGMVRPRVRPEGPVELEDARPPRFAQLLGTIFLGTATVAFALGASTLGWALTLLVTALAALAASTRICVGCLVYERAFLR